MKAKTIPEWQNAQGSANEPAPRISIVIFAIEPRVESGADWFVDWVVRGRPDGASSGLDAAIRCRVSGRVSQALRRNLKRYSRSCRSGEHLRIGGAARLGTGDERKGRGEDIVCIEL